MPTTVEAIEKDTLAVIESSQGLDYVTFSHVWADDLGSDTERGLPACQLLALRGHTFSAKEHASSGSIHYAFPPNPSIGRLQSNRCRMCTVNSAATIILDAGLQSKDLSEATSSHSELFLRFATSVSNHCLCGRLSDETLALAPLLGIPVVPLTSLEGEERMVKSWLVVSRVPKDLVLVELKACDRMTKYGFM